ncbi:hypothetical protein Poly51_28620 [Rubripirellula tenax]|uniref:Sulfatase n=1 Tax=Rubripirellula tenax TaxID=2528015 RepID=A0A5C6F5F2_9BACT|nr:hypothetical protein Poly51_28620 [Rubripirellula tenax]
MSDVRPAQSNHAAKPLIVLSFEGLATAAVGCYGSSWNQTPAIDTIATGGCVWDRWIATDDESAAVMQKWFADQVDHWSQRYRDRGQCSGGAVDLITDDPSIGRHADCFDRVITLPQLPVGDTDEPADDIESTQLASIIAAAIERDSEAEPWNVLWLHSNFLANRWDAPRSLFPIDEIELPSREAFEDVELIGMPNDEVIDEPTLPIFDTVAVPRQPIGDSVDPDWITSWMRTYGCQVRLIDLMIEVLLQSIGVEDPQVIVVGTNGFALGQNGWIGHHCGPLRSPEIRVPMIVSDIGPIRISGPTSDQTMVDLLCQLADGSCSLISPAAWVKTDPSLEIRTQSSRARAAVTTPKWFYVRDEDEQEHLFLKPDDVEDFNDVGRRRLDVIEEFDI